MPLALLYPSSLVRDNVNRVHQLTLMGNLREKREVGKQSERQHGATYLGSRLFKRGFFLRNYKAAEKTLCGGVLF